MTAQPWYAPGLSFGCTQCGNCCTGAPGVVWVTDEEIRAIAAVRQESYGEILHQRTRLVGGHRSLREYPNGDCTFFDGATRRCTVYQARPVQCRTWPFWPSNLTSSEAWERVGTVCPGINQGQFVPIESIEAQARMIDP